MRENNRNSIEKCRKKLPQFTTMNVIDGQAGLIIYTSLIFYSLTIDNILNIIVLLILAGVSIAMLTGQNGILTQAQNAKTTNESKSAEEKVKLAVMGARADDGTLTVGKLRTELANYGETVEGDTFPVTATVDGKSFTVDANGNVELAGEKQPVTREGIEVGDYVSYTPDTATGKTYDADKLKKGGYTSTQTVKKEDLNWRVLRKNDDGSIDLIGDETSNSVYFSGSLGYNNGVYLLNDICKELYSNSTHHITARSVNLEDMEKWLTDSGKTARAGYTNSDRGKKYGETKEYKGSNSYAPDIYGKTEDESANYYSEPTTNTYTPASGTATADNTLNAKQTYYYIPINQTNYGDGAKVLSSSNYYWVAARYVGCYSSDANFGLRFAFSSMSGGDMFDSDSSTYYDNRRLRPVVSLGSDVQITPSTGKNSPSNKHTIDW